MARVVAAKKKVTPERVAAACRQLGPHVSLRAVQQAIGGSLRDIGPLVRQWREQNPPAPGDLTHPSGPDALGALLLARLDAQTQTLVDAQHDEFRVMQEQLSTQIKDKLAQIAAAGLPSRQPATGVATDTLGDVMRSLNALRGDLKAGFPSPGAAQPAASPDLSPILSRLDRLQQRIDELTVQGPAAPDPTPQLALMVDRLSRLEQAFATLPGFFDQLRGELERLTLMAAAPTPPAVLTQALEGLKTQVSELRAAAAPPPIDGALIPLIGEALHRLDLVALGLQALQHHTESSPLDSPLVELANQQGVLADGLSALAMHLTGAIAALDGTPSPKLLPSDRKRRSRASLPTPHRRTDAPKPSLPKRRPTKSASARQKPSNAPLSTKKRASTSHRTPPLRKR